MKFVKAVRSQRKLRLALMGPPGSGKTMTALRVARGLAGPEGKIALIDTENKSASLYAADHPFDVLTLDNFAPENYVQAIEAAAEAGYDVLIIDSLSHAWEGKGGALEMVDEAAKRSKSGNSFTAWRDVTPHHNAMVTAMLQAKLHVIVTVRVKMAYDMQKNDRTNKMEPVKVGLKPIQREGLDFEFDITGDMDKKTLTIDKTRASFLDGEVIVKPGEELGQRLVAWLNSGEAAPEAPKPTARETFIATMKARHKDNWSVTAKAALITAGWDGTAGSITDAMYETAAKVEFTEEPK